MNKKGKLTLILVCFAVIGLLTGLVIKEYVNQEVAIVKQQNIKNIYENDAYMRMK